MENEFSFTGVSKIDMAYTKGDTTSKHIQTKFFLQHSDNLDSKVYLDNEGLPTKEGIKPLSITFVHGLVGSIHLADRNGWWDRKKHIEWIIEQLHKGLDTEGVQIDSDRF